MNPTIEKRRKKPRFIITMEAPTGVPAKNEMLIPIINENADTSALEKVTALYVLNTRIEVREGKIMSALMSREPNILIPRTIVRAESIANSIVYLSLFSPPALENTGSKVTAKRRG